MHNAAESSFDTARTRSEEFQAHSGTFGRRRARSGSSGRSPKLPESARTRPKTAPSRFGQYRNRLKQHYA
eukprot:5433161-Alexandrium_andersonii.AAC.1